MAELRIRKLDDWVASWLKAQAKLHSHSLEKELRELLTETARSQKQQIAEQLLTDLETLEQKHGQFTDGAKGIREERDTGGDGRRFQCRLKWFVPEAGSRKAIALQSGLHNLVAPLPKGEGFDPPGR